MPHGTISRTRPDDMISTLNEWGARLSKQIDHLERTIDQDIACLPIRLTPHQRELVDSLTQRERIIIRHIACGFTSHHIAQLESVAEPTVRCQSNGLYAKLEIAGRTQLAVWSLLCGIVKPADIVSAWREHAPDLLR